MSQIPLLKVVVIGDGNVGKTSLVRRYCESKFEQSRIMTIGVDFQTRQVDLPEGSVKLSIWDMAGQDRFQTIRETFYRGSLAAALVYDLTVPQSLINLATWVREVTRLVPGIRFVVVGNKSDLFTPGSENWGPELARRLNSPYVQTSAASGEGVPALFEALGLAAWQAVHRKHE